MMLDSAGYYLQKSTLSPEKKFKTNIHYFFAREDYTTITSLAENQVAAELDDAWTAYRIGEAYFKLQNFPKAIEYLERACEMQPYDLDFQEKRATAYVYVSNAQKAEEIYRFILAEHPKREVALCNLGYLQVLKGRIQEGAKLYDESLAVNPDYEQALINKAALFLLQKDNEKARSLLNRVLEINPNNTQALQGLQRI